LAATVKRGDAELFFQLSQVVADAGEQRTTKTVRHYLAGTGTGTGTGTGADAVHAVAVAFDELQLEFRFQVA
jgi:hypothetical protein